jgi:hypothetical protein
MPTICPRDGRNCCDDLCRGSGVCVLTGADMWNRCNMCHAVHSEFVDCDCEPDENSLDDDDNDFGISKPAE